MSISNRNSIGYLALAMFLFLATITFAEDNSTNSSNLTIYKNDNSASHSGSDTWGKFNMVYYDTKIFKAYRGVKHGSSGDDWQHGICYYWHDPADEPEDAPVQGFIGQAADADAFRFVVYNSKLYLIFFYQEEGQSKYIMTYMTLQTRGATPALDEWSDCGVVEGDWEGAGEKIQGMVAAVFDDKIHILIQSASSPDIKRIIFDGTTATQDWTYTIQPDAGLVDRINYFSCILNGDCFYRKSDGQQCMAIVTKNDLYGGDVERGFCQLLVYDPGTPSLKWVANLPDYSRDVSIAYGNVDECTPYGSQNMQIWSIGWDDDHLKHIQFTFDDDAGSGTFTNTDWNDLTDKFDNATCSSHDGTDKRGYLATALSSSPVNGSDKTTSLQTNNWVWWYGEMQTDVHGRSLKYKANVLKYKTTYYCDTSDPDDSGYAPHPDNWQLLGLIMGLPPFYPNGNSGNILNNEYVQYGLTTTDQIQTQGSLSNSNTFSLNMNFGVAEAKPPKFSIGLSLSVAFSEALAKSTTISIGTNLKFAASTIDWNTDPGTAWGIFLAPYMFNNHYELMAPDGTTDLGCDCYHTYIDSASSSLTFLPFDMTAPGSEYDGYFTGITNPGGVDNFPDTIAYEKWNDQIYQLQIAGTDNYEMLYSSTVTGGGAGSGTVAISKATMDSTNKDVSVKFSTDMKFFGKVGFNETFSFYYKSYLSSSISENLTMSCSVPSYFSSGGDDPTDIDLYLTEIMNRFFLVNAKTTDCFWIPESCRSNGVKQYPWCLTWYTESYIPYNNDSASIGPEGDYLSLQEGLAAKQDVKNVLFTLDQSVTEDANLTIANQSVSISAPLSSLGEDGIPTVAISVNSISVNSGACLFLKNLIITNNGKGAAILESAGTLSLTNCIITGSGSHGVNQSGGHLTAVNSYFCSNQGAGLVVSGGDAELINCEFICNKGTGVDAQGIQTSGGTVTLKYCALLNADSLSDIYASSQAALNAENSVFGCIAPGSYANLLSYCLVENRPEQFNITEGSACIFGQSATYTYDTTRIISIASDSPCIGAAKSDSLVTTDINSNHRPSEPDIGPLQFSHPVKIEKFKKFHFRYYSVDVNKPDKLAISFKLSGMPEDFLLSADELYKIKIGGLEISSGDFGPGKINRKQTSLKFVDANGSNMRIKYSSKHHTCSVRLVLKKKGIYQELAYWISKATGVAGKQSVYLPLQASLNGNCQTGLNIISSSYNPKRYKLRAAKLLQLNSEESD